MTRAPWRQRASPTCSPRGDDDRRRDASRSGDDGGWRPAPGEWSANECVGHLIEAERRGFAGRIRRSSPTATGRPGRPRGLGPAGRRRGASRPPRNGDRPRGRVRRAAGRERRARPGLRPADLAGAGSIPMSGRSASTSCSASGSITTATTSARCWRSPRRGSGARWATPTVQPRGSVGAMTRRFRRRATSGSFGVVRRRGRSAQPTMPPTVGPTM